jgi:hypothetical protein
MGRKAEQGTPSPLAPFERLSLPFDGPLERRRVDEGAGGVGFEEEERGWSSCDQAVVYVDARAASLHRRTTVVEL